MPSSRPPRRAPLAPRLKEPLKRKPARPLARVPIVALPLVPVSDLQRAKVAGAECLVRGRSPVEPAHLVPRRIGGCDHPDCVIPLCRTHHRLYDHGDLALLPYIGQDLRGSAPMRVSMSQERRSSGPFGASGGSLRRAHSRPCGSNFLQRLFHGRLTRFV